MKPPSPRSTRYRRVALSAFAISAASALVAIWTWDQRWILTALVFLAVAALNGLLTAE